jgi:hypothetical protein
MKTYLYRVLEMDCDGDPLDFGCLRAVDEVAAIAMVRQRMAELEIDEEVPFRLYPAFEPAEGIFPEAGDFVDVLTPEVEEQVRAMHRAGESASTIARRIGIAWCSVWALLGLRQ